MSIRVLITRILAEKKIRVVRGSGPRFGRTSTAGLDEKNCFQSRVHRICAHTRRVGSAAISDASDFCVYPTTRRFAETRKTRNDDVAAVSATTATQPETIKSKKDA